MSCSSGHNDVNINKANVVVEKKINNKRDFDCLLLHWSFYLTLASIFIPNTSNHSICQFLLVYHIIILIFFSYYSLDSKYKSYLLTLRLFLDLFSFK